MGTNNLTNVSAGAVIPHTKLNEIHTALKESFVGRDSNGVPASGKDLGTSLLPWGTLFLDELVLAGEAIDLSEVLNSNPYKVLSGAMRTLSNQPKFLTPAGSGNGRSLTINGSVTPLVLEINGTRVEITTDIVISALSAAPSSNNTASITNSNATDQYETRNWGEPGEINNVLTIQTVGSEISALVGKKAAFKFYNGTDTEYFITTVESATTLKGTYRGYFYGSNGNPIPRIVWSDGDVITLMKLGWIFVDSDGVTVEVTYNEPTYSQETPSSPASGDYWMDLAEGLWKRYNGVTFVETDRILVGMLICDTADCIGARCIDFHANYSPFTTVKVEYVDSGKSRASAMGQSISVCGNLIKFGFSRPTWDMATELLTTSATDNNGETSEQANRFYYFYVSDTGKRIISETKPYWRPDLFGAYHPHNTWRCVGSNYNNASSNFDLFWQEASYAVVGRRLIEDSDRVAAAYQLNSGNGVETYAGATWQNITNGAQVIRRMGRPLLIGLQSSSAKGVFYSETASNDLEIRLTRDGNVIGYWGQAGAGGSLQIMAQLFFIDEIPNDSEQVCTYQFQFRGAIGGANVQVANMKMVSCRL